MSLYNEFHKEMQSYWLKNEPAQVLSILQEGLTRFPEHLAELLFEGIMACIDLKLTEEALSLMKLADENDYWYPAEMFPQDEIYKPYLTKWAKNISTGGTTALEVGKDSGINMLALHGWGEDLHLFRRYFSSELFEQRGRIHYLQSSQQIGSIQYVWTDKKQAEKDVRHYLCEAFDSLKIDFIAGFSQGAQLALNLVLQDVVEIEKLILVCPGKENYAPEVLEKLKEKNVKVLLISGEHDHEHDYHNNLNKVLKSFEVDIEYVTIEGMAHWFPDNIDTLINDFL